MVVVLRGLLKCLIWLLIIHPLVESPRICSFQIQCRSLLLNYGKLGWFSSTVVGSQPNSSIGFFLAVRLLFQSSYSEIQSVVVTTVTLLARVKLFQEILPSPVVLSPRMLCHAMFAFEPFGAFNAVKSPKAREVLGWLGGLVLS